MVPTGEPNVVQPPVDQGHATALPYEAAPVVQSHEHQAPLQSPIYEDAYQALQPHASSGPAPVFSTGSWLWNGRWYLNADYVALKKESPSGRIVAIDTDTIQIDNSNAGGIVLDGALSSDTETHEFESGGRITLGRFLGRDAARRDHMIDFGFMGLFDWNASAELIGSNLQTGLSFGDLRNRLFSVAQFEQITGFFNNDRFRYDYNSSFDSYEINYRIRTRPGRDQMAIHPSGVWTRHASSGQLRGFSAGLRAIGIREGFFGRSVHGRRS